MIRGVNQLSARSVFALVAYNNDQHVWQPRPVRATSAWKAQAISWVEGLHPIEDHCILDALLETLRLAKKARVAPRSKQIIAMYNRNPWCGGAINSGTEAHRANIIETYTSANYQRIRTDVIYVPEWTHEPGEEFGQELAAANGGRFTNYQESGFNN